MSAESISVPADDNDEVIVGNELRYTDDSASDDEKTPDYAAQAPAAFGVRRMVIPRGSNNAQYSLLLPCETIHLPTYVTSYRSHYHVRRRQRTGPGRRHRSSSCLDFYKRTCRGSCCSSLGGICGFLCRLALVSFFLVLLFTIIVFLLLVRSYASQEIIIRDIHLDSDAHPPLAIDFKNHMLKIELESVLEFPATAIPRPSLNNFDVSFELFAVMDDAGENLLPLGHSTSPLVEGPKNILSPPFEGTGKSTLVRAHVQVEAKLFNNIAFFAKLVKQCATRQEIKFAVSVHIARLFQVPLPAFLQKSAVFVPTIVRCE